MCRDLWVHAADFLADPNVVFLGYQVDSMEDGTGWFLFNHLRCSTTVAVGLHGFAGLSQEPVLADSCDVRGVREDFCLARREHRRCPPRCPCAYVTQTARLIQDWGKNPLW
jgi:hypothetical protein